MNGLRILHVFRAPLGGLFRHVLDLARAQAERGHQVGLVCAPTESGDRSDRTLKALAPHLALGVAQFPMPRHPHPGDVPALMRVNRVCRTAQPDVLHGHGAKGGVYARLAFWPEAEERTIRVYTPHGGSFHFGPGTLRHALYMGPERMMAYRTDLFLFESAYVAARFEAFVGRAGGLAQVNLNGVGAAEFEPIVPDPSHDLVFVGELRDLKGIDTLIDALALLRGRGQNPSLLVVGSGPDEQALKQRVRSRDLTEAVAFAPPMPMRQALARGRIMVAPSRAESLPYALLEAAAARQPMVATRVGGVPEIFGPFADDLIPPGDPDVLAAAIAGKLEEPEAARAALAEVLAEWVRGRFTVERMVDGALAAYETARAVQRRPAGAPFPAREAMRA